MRVYQINVTARFSTGTIAKNIHRALEGRGDSARFAFGYGGECEEGYYQISDIWNLRLDAKWMQLTGYEGQFTRLGTTKLIKDIKKFNPDIIHLHNIHGNYLYLPMLFRALKRLNKPVIFTLHDCWAFTGGCYHFYTNGCFKWQSLCEKCRYPRPFLLNKLYKTETRDFNQKKRMLDAVENLTITTVSNWLMSVVRESFLGKRDIYCVPNGVDTSVFRQKNVDLLREKLGCQHKAVLLGVASTWSEKKGLHKWIQLAQSLDSLYQIVLVGLSEAQKRIIPQSIIGLSRVQNTEELVDLYNLAEVYINLSREETFGMPTVEAMACGTPVIVLNTTANPELVTDEVGLVAKDDSLDTLLECIEKTANRGKTKMSEKCIARACNTYSIESMTDNYLQIYDALVCRRES